MNRLALRQEEFLACLLDDAAPPPPGWNARRAAGMAVYRNAYRAQLVDVLRETFERTSRLVGEDAFQRAAAHHLITHPPSGWTIDLAGQGFAETCEELFAHDPDVGEVAWLEWAMHRAFTAADAEPLTALRFAAATAEFSAEQWNALRLRFMPGTSLRAVTHDLVKLWETLAESAPGPQVERLNQHEYALVWRDGERPVFVLVPEQDGRALAALQGGATFGEMCASLAQTADPSEAAESAGAMLLSWLELGLLHAVDTD
jgi:hypothetical protein